MSSVAEKLQRKEQRKVATKQVRLKLVYIDFWSVVKLSFLIWLCLGIVLVVASVLVWIVLNSTGIFGKLDDTLQDILVDPEFHVANTFGLGQVGAVLARRRAAETWSAPCSVRSRACSTTSACASPADCWSGSRTTSRLAIRSAHAVGYSNSRLRAIRGYSSGG